MFEGTVTEPLNATFPFKLMVLVPVAPAWMVTFPVEDLTVISPLDVKVPRPPVEVMEKSLVELNVFFPVAVNTLSAAAPVVVNVFPVEELMAVDPADDVMDTPDDPEALSAPPALIVTDLDAAD